MNTEQRVAVAFETNFLFDYLPVVEGKAVVVGGRVVVVGSAVVGTSHAEF